MAELLIQLKYLSFAEKLQLMRELVKSMEEDSTSNAFSDLSNAQKAELDRRWEAIKNGTAKTVAWESVETKLAQRYGLSN